MALQNGACLHAARLKRTSTAALNKWLLENITTSSLVLPDHPVRFEESLCIVHMALLQGGNDGVFKDPDMYLLSLYVYAPKCGPSQPLHLWGPKTMVMRSRGPSILKPG
ncbi:hypothetical protein B0H14DRAFT_2617694 [Mycena olivaceomarginata]|nr:hypothetical protein B0H14DRAFT_2617694 [Mycena olivaceomarginata]